MGTEIRETVERAIMDEVIHSQVGPRATVIDMNPRRTGTQETTGTTTTEIELTEAAPGQMTEPETEIGTGDETEGESRIKSYTII